MPTILSPGAKPPCSDRLIGLAAGDDRLEILFLDGEQGQAIGRRDADLREAHPLVFERIDAVRLALVLHVELDLLVLLRRHHDRADVVEERLVAIVDPDDVVVGVHPGAPGRAAALDVADDRGLLLNAVQVRGHEARHPEDARS